MLDEETIIKIAEKAGLEMGMLNRLRMTKLENGYLGYRREPGLTIYGEKLVNFAQLIEEHATNKGVKNGSQD